MILVADVSPARVRARGHVLVWLVSAAGSAIALAASRATLSRAMLLVAFLTACLCTSAAQAQPADVRVQLSSPTITIGESVRLAIVASGIDGELDASALEEDFDVVGRSSSRDVQITNGARRSTVTWVLELVPRDVGVFTVPAVSVGGIQSELLTLTVAEAPTGAARDVFVEARVDETAPYVQSQVILTLSVYLAVDIVEGSLAEPSESGFDLRPLGDDTRREETRDGRRYQVTERRLALFPQLSGKLVLPPAELSVTVPGDGTGARGFFAPTRRLNRRSAPIELDVRARPPGGSGWWLPARSLTLEENWSAGAGDVVRVGEPLTRTIGMRASGALDRQLPEMDTPRVDGLAIYADDAVRAEGVGGDGVESTLTLSLAVIPERAGTFELPAVTVDWFDVREERPRTATLPARTVTVRPAERGPTERGPTERGPTESTGSPPPDGGSTTTGADADDASARDTDPDGTPPDGTPPGTGATRATGDVAGLDGARATATASRWRTLALGALVGWAITTGGFALWLWRRRKAHAVGLHDASTAVDGRGGRYPGGSVRDARREVERAVRDGDGPALGRAVLERAALQRPDAPPRSLAELADRFEAATRMAGVVPGEAGGAASGKVAGETTGETADEAAVGKADEPARDARDLAGVLRRLEASIYGRGAPRSPEGARSVPATLPVRLERALGLLDPPRAHARRDAHAADVRDLPPL